MTDLSQVEGPKGFPELPVAKCTDFHKRSNFFRGNMYRIYMRQEVDKHEHLVGEGRWLAMDKALTDRAAELCDQYPHDWVLINKAFREFWEVEMKAAHGLSMTAGGRVGGRRR